MTLFIQDIKQILIDQHRASWDQLLDQREHYSFFETPEWFEFMLQCLPQSKDQSYLIRFSDHNEAILPLVATPKRFGIKKLESLPWGCYGGLIGERPIAAEHICVTANRILSLNKPLLEITVNPLLKMDQPQGVKTIAKETSILKLGNFDELWEKFQSRTRTSIRKAEQEGVTIDYGFSDALINLFHELYLKSSEKWTGVETLPDLFFEKLNSLNETQALIGFAQYQSKPIAADLIFFGKGEVQYFAGASDRDYSNLQASKFLMSEIIKLCCERNYQYFNFGTSAGLAGVEQFKRHLGAEKYCYTTMRFEYPILRFLMKASKSSNQDHHGSDY